MEKNAFLLLITLSFFFSCNPQKENNRVNNVDTTYQKNISKKLEKTVSEMPSSVDFVAHISQAQLAYSEYWTNSVESVTKYQTSTTKAAFNLGIYLTDLGYNALYFKNDQALLYLNAVKELSDHLKILEESNRHLIMRLEKNIDQRDSLLFIAHEGFYNIDQYLRKSKRVAEASYILTGSWVEGLYITSGLLNSYSDQEIEEKTLRPILWRVGGQKRSVEKLINLLSDVPQDQFLEEVLERLKKLKNLFKEVRLTEKENPEEFIDIAEIKSLDELNDQTIIKSITKIDISIATFRKIHEEITQLRNFIIS